MNNRPELPTADNSSNMNGFETSEVASTLEALKIAVTGETCASATYASYGEVAESAGFSHIARLFKAASDAEQIHIRLEAALITEVEPAYQLPIACGVKEYPVDLSLIDAAKGEIFETADMYPAFIKKAQEEGNERAVAVFTKAKLAESVHAEKYLEAYNNMDAPDDDAFFVCPGCGYIHKGTEAPEKCPICGVFGKVFQAY